MADPADAAARDAAGNQLMKAMELLQSAGDRIVWGQFDPRQGYNPDAYWRPEDAPENFRQLAELTPRTWVKAYLSLFMFPGPYTIHQEAHLTVLDIEARFRSGLEDGEYPYPLWHDPAEWAGWVNTARIFLIFEPGRLMAAMRMVPEDGPAVAPRPWNGQWTWTDAQGKPQPRVTQFSYLFSPQNPHLAELDRAYGDLRTALVGHDCLSCHRPDNPARMDDLVLLGYPGQALAAGDLLEEVIVEGVMPPARDRKDPGIHDPAARQRLAALAAAFAQKSMLAEDFEMGRAPEDR